MPLEYFPCDAAKFIHLALQSFPHRPLQLAIARFVACRVKPRAGRSLQRGAHDVGDAGVAGQAENRAAGAR